MSTLRELKTRIGSVASTQKTTSAMKMISSSKMRKATGQLQRLSPYRQMVQHVISHLLVTDQQFDSPLIAERETSLVECESKLAYMFWGPCVLLDEKSVNKILRKEGARADEAIAACREVLADPANEWKAELLEEKCRALAEPLEMKLRNLLQPLRVAVCGNMVSPPLFESIELLSREDVLARIDATVANV